jgi:hypothetical protein
VPQSAPYLILHATKSNAGIELETRSARFDTTHPLGGSWYSSCPPWLRKPQGCHQHRLRMEVNFFFFQETQSAKSDNGDTRLVILSKLQTRHVAPAGTQTHTRYYLPSDFDDASVSYACSTG